MARATSTGKLVGEGTAGAVLVGEVTCSAAMRYDAFGFNVVWPLLQDDHHRSRLGRYELLASIGSGGMAAIYLSKIAGPAGFEKPLAIKVIHSHLVEDQQFVEMFFDEARLASQLQHPNIVQIFELGEADGTYFIAMEYLMGETVGTVIERVFDDEGRTMDPRVACHLMLQAAEGLHFAHELTNIDGVPYDLVHRDISPQNLFVTYSGSVKIMDFGIARAVGSSNPTNPGSLKGKFSYMSPEQVRGKEIDRRCDIFALAVVFWEMLAGRRLFKGRNDLESLRLAEEANHIPVSEFRSGIPSTLDQVIDKALARDPAARYQTALEFHGDLGLVSDQLGSPMTTHELGAKMRAWFAPEFTKKRSQLKQSLPNARGVAGLATSGASSMPPGEGTPSRSDPSGLRIRESMGIAGDSFTPSQSGSVSLPPPVEQILAVDEVERPLGGFTDAGDTEQDAVGSRRGLRLALIVGGVVLAGVLLAVLIALTLSSDPASDEAVAPTPTAATTDPAVVERQPPPEPEPPPDPPPDPAAPPDPEEVTVELTIHAPGAEVTIDGEAVEDPERIQLARSDEPVSLEVDAPGHRPETLMVTPDRDQRREVTLRRRPTRPRTSPPAKRRTPRRSTEELLPSPYATD